LVIQEVSFDLLRRHYTDEEISGLIARRMEDAFPEGVKNMHDIVNEMEDSIWRYIR